MLFYRSVHRFSWWNKRETTGLLLIIEVICPTIYPRYYFKKSAFNLHYWRPWERRCFCHVVLCICNSALYDVIFQMYIWSKLLRNIQRTNKAASTEVLSVQGDLFVTAFLIYCHLTFLIAYHSIISIFPVFSKSVIKLIQLIFSARQRNSYIKL